jgi:hypothetical protein
VLKGQNNNKFMGTLSGTKDQTPMFGKIEDVTSITETIKEKKEKEAAIAKLI